MCPVISERTSPPSRLWTGTTLRDDGTMNSALYQEILRENLQMFSFLHRDVKDSVALITNAWLPLLRLLDSGGKLLYHIGLDVSSSLNK